MDRRRTFNTPTKDSFASDYINNKKAKVKYAGTSNLASTVAEQGGMFPLRTPSGHLKPYQGTYSFSSATSVQGAPPSTYCLNQCRSYSDYIDITRGKYLLTPPNPTTTCVKASQLAFISEIFSGSFLESRGYTGVAESMVFNKSIIAGPSGPTGPTGTINRIVYDPLTSANQYIRVDPSYNLFYDKSGCLISSNTLFIDKTNILQKASAQREVDRFLNLDLSNGFNYPSKFALNYNPKDCINVNNDLQPGPYPNCPP
jgi:hypothetical protein